MVEENNMDDIIKSPTAIQRSLSHSDVLDTSGGSVSINKQRRPVLPIMTQINAQPQNFVVVNGQSFRVTRSPRYTVNTSYESVEGNRTSNDEDETVLLQRQLEEAELKIAKQQTLLAKQHKRVEDLEKTLIKNGIALPNSNSSSPLTKPSTNNRIEVIKERNGGGSILGLAARRRAEAKSILVSGVGSDSDSPTKIKDMMLNVNDGNDIKILTSQTQKASKTLDFFGTTDFITPTNACIVNSNNPSFSAPPQLKSSKTTSSNHIPPFIADDLDGGILDEGYNSETKSSKAPPKGLAARLSMGSQERRKMAAAKSRLKKLPKAVSKTVNDGVDADSSTTPITLNSPDSEGANFNILPASRTHIVTTPITNPNSRKTPGSVAPQFQWRDGLSNVNQDGSLKFYLFIAHDNPQLGYSISSQLVTDDTGMKLMIESKDENNLTYFLNATIVYSGDVDGVEGADSTNPRGSQFIVCTDLQAIKADIKSFPIRTMGDIQEIKIDGVEPDCFVDVSDQEKLISFLTPCVSRVDVILDPSHTNTWYPYWEGRRKMAPQFRSKGIGYIRLGDDMSRFGKAFLSLDAGASYLDDGATSIVAIPGMLDTISGGFPAISLKGINSETSNGDDSGINSRVNSANGSSRSRCKARGLIVENMKNTYPQDLEDLRDILTRLKDDDLKWSERTEVLKRLKLCPGCKDSQYITDVISVLINSITKQKNPHVLCTSVSCIRILGDSASNHVNCAVAWRSLMLESIHLMRVVSKPVVEEARHALDSLHGKCLSLGHLSLMLDEIFAGPRGKGSGGASNSTKIVQWLDNIATIELNFIAQKLLFGSSIIGPNIRIIRPSSSNSASRTIVNGELFYEKVDISNTFQKCKQLLLHREESTREAAVAFVSTIIVYDFFQHNDDPVTLPSLIVKIEKSSNNTSPVSTGNLSSPTNAPNNSFFLRCLSSSCSAVLAEVDKSSPRMYEKIIPFTMKLIKKVIANAVLVNTNKSIINSEKIIKTPRNSNKNFTSNTSPISNSPVMFDKNTSSAMLQQLSDSWYETRLILRMIPSTESAWRQLSTVIKESSSFFQLLSSTATCNNMPQGTLIRIVLPFDEDTSSNDQSIINSKSRQSNVNNTDKINESTLNILKEQAVSLRRLIRVKMADEADLQQVIL
jgi:hypothetical protein